MMLVDFIRKIFSHEFNRNGVASWHELPLRRSFGPFGVSLGRITFLDIHTILAFFFKFIDILTWLF